MVTLEPVNEGNFRAVVDMKLPPEQSRFVAPNVVSLAQAWLYYDEARPFAVCSDGEAVGFMMLDWDEGERTVGVWRFMIAAEHQRKGFGRRALEAAIALARETGAFDMMHLDYVPENTAARDLYYSLGFRENGDVEEGEIVMTLPLTDAPKVGMLTADGEDIEELIELIGAELEAGRPVPEGFDDAEYIKAEVSAGRVKRLTLMGETIGMALHGGLLVADEYADRLDEARQRASALDE